VFKIILPCSRVVGLTVVVIIGATSILDCVLQQSIINLSRCENVNTLSMECLLFPPSKVNVASGVVVNTLPMSAVFVYDLTDVFALVWIVNLNVITQLSDTVLILYLPLSIYLVDLFRLPLKTIEVPSNVAAHITSNIVE
jgi:hypothetical protein